MRESDQQLVLRAQLRDREAYSELVVRHQDRVRGWLGHLCGDSVEADDLAQDAFVRAWDGLSSLRDSARFREWVMKIAYNEFLQSRRSLQRRIRLIRGLEAERDTADLASAAMGDAPITAVDLRKVLSILSERERAVVVLNYAFGYSATEVSELTGMPLGTVKSLILRGSRKARERFNEPS